MINWRIFYTIVSNLEIEYDITALHVASNVINVGFAQIFVHRLVEIECEKTYVRFSSLSSDVNNLATNVKILTLFLIDIFLSSPINYIMYSRMLNIN